MVYHYLWIYYRNNKKNGFHFLSWGCDSAIMMTKLQITLLQPKKLASFLTAIISTMHPLPQCLCQNNITWQYKGFSFILCLTIATLILIVTFQPHTADLHQAIVSIYWVELFVPLWLLVTGVSQTLLSEWVNQTTWLSTSSTADRWGVSFFISQCQQCFGLKPTNHERGLWYTSH